MFKIYVPYSDTTKAARCLDDDLLWQQLHDVPLLVQAIADSDERTRLLCVKQWRGYEGYLANFVHRMQIEAQKRELGSWLDEWQDSPYAETWKVIRQAKFNPASRPPRWIGGGWFLHSNRSELIRIRPEHYAHQFPTTPLEMPFLYPQNTEGFDYTITMSMRDRQLVTARERLVAPQFADYVREKWL